MQHKYKITKHQIIDNTHVFLHIFGCTATKTPSKIWTLQTLICFSQNKFFL